MGLFRRGGSGVDAEWGPLWSPALGMSHSVEVEVRKKDEKKRGRMAPFRRGGVAAMGGGDACVALVLLIFNH
jgi:hypothetical protein